VKITDIEIFKVKPRWIFVKVNTDTGISGWGECIGGTRTETVVNCIRETGQYLIGKNPLEIERHWQLMYRFFFRGGPVHMTAVSGIEMALWDIKGKYYDAPVYDLLGGKVRERLMVYSWIGGDRPEAVGEEALDRRNRGFKAVKLLATQEMHYIDSYEKVAQVCQNMQAIRTAVGNDLQVGIDFHGRVHKAMAKILIKELEPFNPMFIEEPVLPENEDAFISLSQQTHLPLATGERLCTRWAYKNLLSSGAVDIIQPDVALVGGILETKKICAMAEAYDVAVAPHAPYGPIALAATFQIDACTPNVFIQEQSLGIHYNKGFDLLDFVKNKEIFDFNDGYADVPTKPGLGIELDEALIREKALEDLNWSNPKWVNDDGTIAEW
jgi:galactonate dehydratase